MKTIIANNFILSIALILIIAITATCGSGTKKPGAGTSSGDEYAGMSDEEIVAKEMGKRLEGAAGAADYSSTGIAIRKELEAKGIIGKKRKRNGKSGSAATDKAAKEEMDDASSMTKDRSSSDKKPTGASGLKAGFADDNKQFNYFIDFLNKYKVKSYPLNIQERIVLRLRDANNKSIPNATVKIFGNKKLLASGVTFADGSFMFFPSEYDKKIFKYKAELAYNRDEMTIPIDRQGKRDITVNWDIQRTEIKKIPLDVVFIFDTTGSMGEEIARLKKTIEIIYMNLSQISPKPRVRFGMVLYKDRKDTYVTKVVPLTGDLSAFQRELDKVYASGGGDYPEDLQSALSDAVNKIEWDPRGIRLSFIITDASAHLDYGQDFTYVKSAQKAKAQGIKIFSVGTGGLNIDGEYVLRQISQYTSAKYIFLTYGEKGESAGGKEGSVSHHTGANFQTDKLETIIIRFAKEELANLSAIKLDQGDEHFSAIKVSFEKREETLQKLFGQAIGQLADYSAIGIEKNTPVSVLPINPAKKAFASNAEYFTEQLGHAMTKSGRFRLVERKNMQKILKELELQMTGLVDESNAARVGKMLGARMLVVGKLYQKDRTYELFLKLVRVETAEIVAATKARIDSKLGID